MQKQRKQPKKAKLKLKLFEEIVQVPLDDYGNYKINVPVVVLAADRNEALTKVNNRKWWKKTGLRLTEEFR